MDDLFELVLTIVFEVIGDGIEASFRTKDQIKVDWIKEERETYVVALLATAITMSYEDDGTLDRHEKELINNLMTNHQHELSKKTVKLMKRMRRKTINRNKLINIFQDLNLTYDQVQQTIHIIESMFYPYQNEKRSDLLQYLKTN
jgi:hypothetical protein